MAPNIKPSCHKT